MRSKNEINRIWAPPDALWSRWVKPVLFAFCDAVLDAPAVRSARSQTDWIPAPRSFVIVVDLPGEEGVACGIELARHGYRPIPLYNALPFPSSEKQLAPETRSKTTVNVAPILAAICRETATLQEIRLSPASPPAFLLDADRRIARIDPVAGVFDNRSVCFETDFPSAEFLLTHGIGSAIVLQKDSEIAGDLAQTLLAWQQRGVHVFLKRIDDKGPARSVVVQKPSLLRRLWHSVSVTLGLRRGELGAFGGIVPSAG